MPLEMTTAGEIIDDLNNSFVTCKWGASYIVDMSHWRKFKAFAPLRNRVTKLHGRYWSVSLTSQKANALISSSTNPMSFASET